MKIETLNQLIHQGMNTLSWQKNISYFGWAYSVTSALYVHDAVVSVNLCCVAAKHNAIYQILLLTIIIVNTGISL